MKLILSFTCASVALLVFVIIFVYLNNSIVYCPVPDYPEVQSIKVNFSGRKNIQFEFDDEMDTSRLLTRLRQGRKVSSGAEWKVSGNIALMLKSGEKQSFTVFQTSSEDLVYKFQGKYYQGPDENAFLKMLKRIEGR